MADGYITKGMIRACSSCRRPVPLSRDEIVLLRSARATPAGLPMASLAQDMTACVRALVRMGYVIKTANDDGHHGRRVLITERGLGWLAEND